MTDERLLQEQQAQPMEQSSSVEVLPEATEFITNVALDVATDDDDSIFSAVKEQASEAASAIAEAASEAAEVASNAVEAVGSIISGILD